MTKQDKSDAQRIHAKRRLVERYGIAINDEEYNRMRNKIRLIGKPSPKAEKLRGQAKFVKKQSHRISLWDVQTDCGIWVRAVYDKTRKTIVTVLPVEAI